MGLHDTMAVKAYTSGKTSGEFLTVAQRHADMSWFFALPTGATWYFADGIWALIPGALLVLSVLKSVSSTAIASRLEKIEGSS